MGEVLGLFWRLVDVFVLVCFGVCCLCVFAVCVWMVWVSLWRSRRR